MPRLTKRLVDAAKPMATDQIIWDDGIPGFGLRVLKSGRRSYIIQYRAAGRSRRFTIGVHGIWTPEKARQEAMAQLGRAARRPETGGAVGSVPGLSRAILIYPKGYVSKL